MQQTSTEGVQYWAQQGGIVDPLGVVQKTEFWPYYQMIFVQTSIRSRE